MNTAAIAELKNKMSRDPWDIHVTDTGALLMRADGKVIASFERKEDAELVVELIARLDDILQSGAYIEDLQDEVRHLEDVAVYTQYEAAEQGIGVGGV